MPNRLITVNSYQAIDIESIIQEANVRLSLTRFCDSAALVVLSNIKWMRVEIRLPCGAGGRHRCDYSHFFAVRWTHIMAHVHF